MDQQGSCLTVDGRKYTMNADDFKLLFDALNKVIFLLQTLCISTSCMCGVAFMQMIIHTKNQKNLI